MDGIKYLNTDGKNALHLLEIILKNGKAILAVCSLYVFLIT